MPDLLAHLSSRIDWIGESFGHDELHIGGLRRGEYADGYARCGGAEHAGRRCAEREVDRVWTPAPSAAR